MPKLAALKMAQEKPGQTLQATALVHEAYLRLVDSGQQQSWENRRHFFAAAAEAMRRILVENARRKSRPKHGGNREQLGFAQDRLPSGGSPDELLRVDEAFEQLAADDKTAAQIVKLCYFGGLAVEQSAELLGISRATAYRHWTYAKAWLHAEITRADLSAKPPKVLQLREIFGTRKSHGSLVRRVNDHHIGGIDP